jgi:hypothetical protein
LYLVCYTLVIFTLFVSFYNPTALPKPLLWLIDGCFFKVFFYFATLYAKFFLYILKNTPNFPSISKEKRDALRKFFVYTIPNPFYIFYFGMLVCDMCTELMFAIVSFPLYPSRFYKWYFFWLYPVIHLIQTYFFLKHPITNKIINKPSLFYSWLFAFRYPITNHPQINTFFKLNPFTISPKTSLISSYFYLHTLLRANPWVPEPSWDYLYLFQNNQLLSLRFLVFINQHEDLKLFTSVVVNSPKPHCQIIPLGFASRDLKYRDSDLKTIESDFNLTTLR